MKVSILTIVLDGTPWIAHHYPEFENLDFDFDWHVVEGVSAPDNCTSWCSNETPRLSNDGTTQYLDSIAAHDPRVILHRKELWRGKVAMVNAPLRIMHEPCLLIQMDSDELWTAEQIKTLRQMFMDTPAKNCAWFHCDYRVGRNIRITSRNGFGNNDAYEWKRAWRWTPGMFFKTHEPPTLDHLVENAFTHQETEAKGVVFRHEAYSTERQLAFKQSFYGSKNNALGHLYKDAIGGWKRLRDNREWPVKDLKSFLAWAGDNVTADKI